MLVVDGGVENFNGGVDALIGKGVLRRVLALTELQFSKFRGQTPDEMYFGRGCTVPGKLAVAKKAAQEARLDANRAMSCERCGSQNAGAGGTGDVAA